MTGTIVMKHCIMHHCSAHFDQNKVLITSFSRVINIYVVYKMLVQCSGVSPSHQIKENLI